MDSHLVSLFGNGGEDSDDSDVDESALSFALDKTQQKSPQMHANPGANSVSHRHKPLASKQRRMRTCASMGSIQSFLKATSTEHSKDSGFNFLFDEDFVEDENSCVVPQQHHALPDTPLTLPPEVEEGNVEYKRQLVNLTAERFEHLVTQLNWRLAEGEGEAIYELGVEDNGRIDGLDYAEMRESLDTLRQMAARLGAHVTVLRERHVSASETVQRDNRLSSGGKRSLEVLVKREPPEVRTREIRLVLLGNMDAGKSTLVGVLSQGELDNGRGRARLNLFRHPHEILSGRTSCISSELLVYDEYGELLNTRLSHAATRYTNAVQDVYAGHVASVPAHLNELNGPLPCRSQDRARSSNSKSASKVVALIDLAGHWKYQRTTLYGLTSRGPHFAMLVVSAASGFVKRSQEHCLLALALRLQLVVVINKCDLAAPAATLAQLQYWLANRHCRYGQHACAPMLVEVTNDAEVDVAVMRLQQLTCCTSSSHGKVERECPVPVFCVSCVTGQGLSQLSRFLGKLGIHEPDSCSACSNASHHDGKENVNEVEFCITQVFKPSSVRGQVLQGLLHCGRIESGQTLFMGPCDQGRFVTVRITSVHKNRLAQRVAMAGEMASLAIDVLSAASGQDSSPTGAEVSVPQARRGMVLLHMLPPMNDQSGPCFEFEASLFAPLSSMDNIEPAAVHNPVKQYTIYCGAFCQAVQVEGELRDAEAEPTHAEYTTQQLKPRYFAKLRFMRRPEYVQVNKVFIYRSGPSQGHGVVLRIYPIEQTQRT